MPKSKRVSAVSLTKTTRKGHASKAQLVDEIRKCVDNYPFIYLFRVHNMRNSHFKSIRGEWNDSRFFMGKNRVMANALGTTEDSALTENLHLLAKKLNGLNIGLLFSTKSLEETQKYFEKKVESDYARTGAIATKTVTLSQGPLMRCDEPLPHSMETFVRKLGAPTLLQKGVVTLQRDYTICEEGKVLSANQANLLKVLCIQMADFKVELLAFYHQGKFEALASEEEDEECNDNEDMMSSEE